MSDEQPDGVLGSLPKTRPHRRSDKRRVAPNEPKRRPPAERTARPKPAPPPPADSGDGILTTAVQAAAELAEIGLTASARALREALSHLPRP
jgi:hypothetical protein